MTEDHALLEDAIALQVNVTRHNSFVDATQQTKTTPICCDRIAAKVFSRKFTSEGLSDANSATALVGGCDKSKNTRENDHGNGCQTNDHRIRRHSQAHPQIALDGIEEKAEQLEKELLQHAVMDTVVSVQNETELRQTQREDGLSSKRYKR
jgi:hypothetical protein